MMKIVLVFVIGCLAVSTVSAGPAYTSKYDNIDLEKILSSQRLLTNYYNCLMEKGNCTPEGRDLKEIIPEAADNNCANCSPKQKEGVRKVIRYLMKNKPDMWAGLTQKYDPEGKYEERYLAEEPEKTA